MNPQGKTPVEIATEGLDRMEQWMKDLGLIMHLTELGVREDMMEDLVDATLLMEGGYKILNRDEILQIFKESM